MIGAMCLELNMREPENNKYEVWILHYGWDGAWCRRVGMDCPRVLVEGAGSRDLDKMIA